MEAFPRYWPFAREIHRPSVNFQHKGQWRGALMFSLICAWINGWVNNREAGGGRRHIAHHDVSVIKRKKVDLNYRHWSSEVSFSTSYIYSIAWHICGKQNNGKVEKIPQTIWWLQVFKKSRNITSCNIEESVSYPKPLHQYIMEVLSTSNTCFLLRVG